MFLTNSDQWILTKLWMREKCGREMLMRETITSAEACGRSKQNAWASRRMRETWQPCWFITNIVITNVDWHLISFTLLVMRCLNCSNPPLGCSGVAVNFDSPIKWLPQSLYPRIFWLPQSLDTSILWLPGVVSSWEIVTPLGIFWLP